MSNKLKIYLLEILLIGVLFFTLFVPNIINKLTLSIIMVLFTVLVHFVVKRKSTNSIYEKQVTLLMLIFAALYLGIFYLMGLHYGYVKTKYVFALNNIINYLIPTLIIIITSEILRKKFINEDVVLKIKNKKYDISICLIYIAMVLVDLIIYTGIYDLTNLDDFLTAIGFVLFASLSCNLLYNYMSKRYGPNGIIVFRLITSLYVYIMPIIPDVYLFFRTFFRIICPYFIYLVFESTYSKGDFAVAYKDRRMNIISTSLLLIVVVLLIMLVSCEFRFGIVVVGSESMNGTINKGDAIIYERYDDGDIRKGQVVIFDYNNVKTIHRIARVRKVNQEVRYYTKGDANDKEDDGYRTVSEIKGLVKLRIKYIGIPSLWLRSLFD